MSSGEHSVDPSIELCSTVNEIKTSSVDVEPSQNEETVLLHANIPNGDSCSKILFTEVNDFKEEQKPTDMISFKIVYNKQTYSVTFPLDDTVESLKLHIEKLTEVPIQMQKLMFKGRMKEEGTLRDNKVTTGSKIMVVGSTMNDIIAVSQASSSVVKESNSVAGTSSKEPLSKQKPHKTILEKYGMPDDVMPGIKNCQEPLPRIPLSGMYNKSGGRVRLTFKLEADQVWIGTKERTEKLSLGSIKAVVSEPIDGHEQYHLMALQLGPTEASRYWIYWVPSQYINAIKDAILGNWQFF